MDRYGRVDPDARRRGHHRQDDPRLDHVREQRGRDDPADRRDREREWPRTAGVLLHVDAVQAAAQHRARPGVARRRPGLVRGPQVRGPEGRRRAVRPPRHAHPRPAAGRHARSATGGPARRTWPASSGWPGAYELTVRERPETARRLRRLPRSPADRGPRGRGNRAHGPPARPAAGSPLAHRERRGRHGRGAGAGPRRNRVLGRFRMRDRLHRGLARADRDGLPGGRGARLAATLAGPHDDGRRGGARLPRSFRGRSQGCASGRPCSPPIHWARASARDRASGLPADGRVSWSRCRAASIRRSRPRCSTSRATTSSASGCGCTTSPTRTRSSRRAAARSTRPTMPGGSPRSSAFRST